MQPRFIELIVYYNYDHKLKCFLEESSSVIISKKMLYKILLREKFYKSLWLCSANT